MRRYLVVANRTLHRAELQEELRKRISAGSCSFFVLVPNTRATQYDAVAAGGVLLQPGMWWWVTDYAPPATDEEATSPGLATAQPDAGRPRCAGRSRPGRSREFQPARGHGEGVHRSPVRRDHRGHLAPAHLALAQGRSAPSGRAPVRAASHDHHHEALTPAGHELVRIPALARSCRRACRAARATVATGNSLSVSSESSWADRLDMVAVMAVPGASLQSLVTESSYQGRD